MALFFPSAFFYSQSHGFDTAHAPSLDLSFEPKNIWMHLALGLAYVDYVCVYPPFTLLNDDGLTPGAYIYLFESL